MPDDIARARVELDLQLVAAAAYPESVGGSGTVQRFDILTSLQFQKARRLLAD
jgi:hypothetical protein